MDASDELDSLFRAHYQRIARAIGRVVYDQARAEELAVDVFLRYWRNPPAHGDLAEGWLYRTAIREALDELRRKMRRSRFERLFGRGSITPINPEAQWSAAVEQQNVRTVLAAMNRRQAEMLLLRYEGLSYQDLAALALNPNSIGTLLSRAQEAFRKEYVRRYGNQ